MANIYKSSWKGSVIPEVKSGIASFSCAGDEAEIYLDDFKDFQNICNILDSVIEQSHYQTKADLSTKINSILK